MFKTFVRNTLKQTILAKRIEATLDNEINESNIKKSITQLQEIYNEEAYDNFCSENELDKITTLFERKCEIEHVILQINDIGANTLSTIYITLAPAFFTYIISLFFEKNISTTIFMTLSYIIGPLIYIITKYNILFQSHVYEKDKKASLRGLIYKKEIEIIDEKINNLLDS